MGCPSPTQEAGNNSLAFWSNESKRGCCRGWLSWGRGLGHRMPHSHMPGSGVDWRWGVVMARLSLLRPSPGFLTPGPCFPLVQRAPSVVFKLYFKAPQGREEISTALEKGCHGGPPWEPTHVLPPLQARPNLQDVAAKRRWGRGRRGGRRPGICILGTRRWELQVPAA